VQIVNASLADAFARGGKWLACKPGCAQCCVGVFAINQLDAARLRKGLAALEAQDPGRAARVRNRALEVVSRLSSGFPGDPATGIISESDDMVDQWNDFANDEPCPVLDPETKTCELYEYRPIICRTFGPPLRSEGDLGVCDLCFEGATEQEIEACEMIPDPDGLEAAVRAEHETATGASGETIIAFALVR